MSFLAPLFLLGALGIAGPVLFHLIRRTTRERVKFSSLMFLQPTPPKLTKRSRIEHWLLLLLRALALALLALAFARPFWRAPQAPPATAAGGRTLVLLDTSASMRREGLWNEALEKAREAVSEAAERDDVAVASFDQAPRVVMDFDAWRALPPAERASQALARLETLAPTWLGTDLASALTEAAELLAEGDAAGASPRRRLVLISDAQEGSRLDAIQSFDWPKEIEVVLETIAAKNPGNAGLQLAAAKTGGSADEGARLRVGNAADSATEKFQAGWATETGAAFTGAAVDVYVPPGQSRSVTLPWPNGTPAPGLIRLEGDAESFDNLLAISPPPQKQVVLPYWGSADAADPQQPLFFLQKALPQSPQIRIEITPFAPEAAPPAAAALETSPLLVAGDSLSQENAALLRQRMEAGATVLFTMPSAEAAPTLARLAGVDEVSVEDIAPPHYALLGQIDFRHALFAPFADPRFSDFTKIRFWKYRKIDPAALPGAQVVAAFDSGAPALLEMPGGQGRLLVLTSRWTPDDSQLAVSSKFPPLLAALLEWSGASAPVPSAFTVGDPLPRRALTDGSGPVTLKSPGGFEITVSADEEAYPATAMPGLYQVSDDTSARALPVNLDPLESLTAPLTADDFERLGVPLARPAEAAKSPGSPSEPTAAMEAENQQKLWRWFLFAALGVLLLETLLAGRAARRSLTPLEATP